MVDIANLLGLAAEFPTRALGFKLVFGELLAGCGEGAFDLKEAGTLLLLFGVLQGQCGRGFVVGNSGFAEFKGDFGGLALEVAEAV